MESRRVLGASVLCRASTIDGCVPEGGGRDRRRGGAGPAARRTN